MHQELSPREREVVALAADGMTNKEIALATGLSAATVKDYVANACHKAGVTNRINRGLNHEQVDYQTLNIPRCDVGHGHSLRSDSSLAGQ